MSTRHSQPSPPVFSNDYLILLNVNIPPGGNTGYHIHLAGRTRRAQHETFAALLADVDDADFRTEVEIFGNRLSRGAFIVFVVLGGFAAGSGAMTALVVTTLPSTATQLAYLLLFGVGSTLGMAALSGALGWPLARAGTNRAFVRTLSLVVGCVSTALGVLWGYPLVERLF